MSQYHPRFVPWTPKHVEKMDLGVSYRIYRERFRDAGNFTFLFVGAFDPVSIRPLVEQYLGGLPSVGSGESWADVTYEYPRGVINKQVFKGKEPKSLCSIIYSGPLAWSRESVYRAEAMMDLLRIRLRERLREDMGGTYGVGVRGLFPRIPRQRYQVTVQFGCDPERVDELVEEVYSLIDSLRTVGTTEDYLAKVREIDLREFEVQIKQNRYWLGELEFAAFHGQDPRLIPEFPRMARALTLEDLRQTARELLGDENRVKVVLYPESWMRK
jgi:zinc protease